jgi:hypothetical protein
MTLTEFFNTAPKTKSNKVLRLEKVGLMDELVQAIKQERSNQPQTGRIKVRRVG